MTSALPPYLLAFVALAVINFLTVPLATSAMRAGTDGEIVTVVGLGLFLSQFGILPAWLVWGPRPYWQRVLIHWAAVAGLSLAWVLGLLCSELSGTPFEPESMLRDIVPGFLLLPAISLGVEAPLWVTRLNFGWRFVRPTSRAVEERKLAIRDFLSGTSVIAFALGAARLAMAMGDSSPDFEIWIPLAISGGCAAVASALALPLLVWSLLRLDDWRGGLAVITVYGLAVYCLLTMALATLLGPVRTIQPYAWLLLLQLTFTVAVAASFGLARRTGYRLWTARSSVG